MIAGNIEIFYELVKKETPQAFVGSAVAREQGAFDDLRQIH